MNYFKQLKSKRKRVDNIRIFLRTVMLVFIMSLMQEGTSITRTNTIFLQYLFLSYFNTVSITLMIFYVYIFIASFFHIVIKQFFSHMYFILPTFLFKCAASWTLVPSHDAGGAKRAKGSGFQTVSSLYRVNTVAYQCR